MVCKLDSLMGIQDTAVQIHRYFGKGLERIGKGVPSQTVQENQLQPMQRQRESATTTIC